MNDSDQIYRRTLKEVLIATGPLLLATFLLVQFDALYGNVSNLLPPFLLWVVVMGSGLRLTQRRRADLTWLVRLLTVATVASLGGVAFGSYYLDFSVIVEWQAIFVVCMISTVFVLMKHETAGGENGAA